MPPPVQLALSDFMDAVVIVDPAEYQRRPEEPARPLRTLPFGVMNYGSGTVTPITTATNKAEKAIKVGAGPGPIVISRH